MGHGHNRDSRGFAQEDVPTAVLEERPSLREPLPILRLTHRLHVYHFSSQRLVITSTNLAVDMILLVVISLLCFVPQQIFPCFERFMAMVAEEFVVGERIVVWIHDAGDLGWQGYCSERR
jgi:hypothetical protein